jgi:hypothetical protein
MDPKQFLAGQTRETNIRRDAQGRWFDGDVLLEHAKLVRAFDRWLGRAEDGRYCLLNDINWAYVSIDGPPLFVRAVTFDAKEPDSLPWLTLSDDRTERLNAQTLRQGRDDDALYCDAREGQLPARFDRHAQQQLEPVLREDDAGVYLALGKERVRPPIVDDPLKPVT